MMSKGATGLCGTSAMLAHHVENTRVHAALLNYKEMQRLLNNTYRTLVSSVSSIIISKAEPGANGVIDEKERMVLAP